MAAPRSSPCERCDARCCRSYSVHLTLDDAGRIARGLDVPMRRFAAHLPQPVRTATGFVLERGGRTHDLVLGYRPASEPERGCLFLEGGRCSVYALRPRACRRFPAAVQGGGVVAREGIVCGTERWAGAMARRSWRAELERERREVALHEVVVGAWNERIAAEGGEARALDRYLEHLEDAWRVVERLRGTLRPRERSGEAFLARVGDILRALPRV
jgi:Fe-S-cluster containining protein